METILGIIVMAVIGVAVSALKNAAARGAANNRGGGTGTTSMDERLRQEIRQRAAATRQAPADARFPFETSQPPLDGANSRWPIEPNINPEQPQVRPSYASAAPRVAIQDDAGGPEDRAVTRRVARPAYKAEDSHGRVRAPHLQDDERGMDSFTGAATFRLATTRARDERIDIRPLLQSPLAMANAVILTEVLHHRGGRSAKWSR